MDLSVDENSSNNNNNNDIQGSAAGWRIRDMAQQLLSRRVQSEEFTNREKSMSLSNQFDVDTCLARIRRDKAAVIRTAFEAAASTVLNSLEGSDSQTSQESDIESINEEDLPSIFSETKQLSEIRVASLERAYDNKDAAKRKIARQQELPRNEKELGKQKKVKKGGRPGRKKSDAPKFTRNTPASSAAAMDSRLTMCTRHPWSGNSTMISPMHSSKLMRIRDTIYGPITENMVLDMLRLNPLWTPSQYGFQLMN